jgi:molybdopterin-guanine dinucleotide biosynthesis protein A
VTAGDGIAAVVLAGGRSRRMGADKALIEVGGEPLVARVCRALAAACEPVVLVAAPGQSLPTVPGVRRVRDAEPFEGPLVGARTGLLAIGAADPARALIVGVDAVRITPELVRALALSGDGAVVVADGQASQPLPAVVPVWRALREAERLVASGERRLRALIDALGPRRVRRDELLAHADLRRVDPALLGLDDADDPEALARLLGG